MRRKSCGILIAFVLAFILSAVFGNPVVHAEEIEGTFTYVTSDTERKNRLKEETFYYRDSFFDCSSYDLNTELAALSIRLAFAGFGYGEESEPYNLLPFFDKLGFRYTAENVHYGKPSADSIGYAFGLRELGNGRAVLLLVVRGGNYGDEWAGNFTLGTGTEHQGFQTASEQILKELLPYILEVSKEKDLSVWITGYSRGAAVSDMTAASLDRLAASGELGTVTPEDIYTYCFACPLVTRRTFSEEESALYRNIFSFISDTDAVPKVAPGNWGYQRYGITFTFPSLRNCKEYDTLSVRMKERFCRYAEASEYNVNSAQAVYLDRAMKRLTDLIGSPGNYVSLLQDTARAAVLSDGTAAGPLSAVFLPIIKSYLADMKEKPSGDSPTNFGLAHAPEICMAWLDVLGDGTPLLSCAKRYGYLSFDGSASICVYDTDGTLLIEAEDKKVIGHVPSTASAIFGTDGEFLLSCPTDAEFLITFSAGKRGRTDFICAVYDTEVCAEQLRYYYKSVLIKKDQAALLRFSLKSPELYICEKKELDGLFTAFLSGEKLPVSVTEPDSVQRGNPVITPEVKIAATPTPTPTPSPTPTLTPTPTAVPGKGAKDIFGYGPAGWILIGLASLIVIGLLILALLYFLRKRQEREA